MWADVSFARMCAEAVPVLDNNFMNQYVTFSNPLQFISFQLSYLSALHDLDTEGVIK
jgi:hypothetical protein